MLGLVREMVADYYFGVAGRDQRVHDRVPGPEHVRALVADAALSSAFVPVFSDLLEKGERKRAWRVASSLFWLMLLGLGGAHARSSSCSRRCDRAALPGRSTSLLVGLSRVLFPIVALLGVSGIIVGILNSYDEFIDPGALAGRLEPRDHRRARARRPARRRRPTQKLYVYAGSILVATIVQVLLPLPWLRGRDGRLQLVIDWRDPAVGSVFKLMLPVTLGLGLINVNALIDTCLRLALIDPTSRRPRSTRRSASTCSRRGCSRSRSRPCSSRRSRGSRRAATWTASASTVSLGLRQIAFLLVPASVVTAVLAEPLIRLLYQRGAFTAAQTPVVAACARGVQRSASRSTGRC